MATSVLTAMGMEIRSGFGNLAYQQIFRIIKPHSVCSNHLEPEKHIELPTLEITTKALAQRASSVPQVFHFDPYPWKPHKTSLLRDPKDTCHWSFHKWSFEFPGCYRQFGIQTKSTTNSVELLPSVSGLYIYLPASTLKILPQDRWAFCFHSEVPSRHISSLSTGSWR
jgi:hypothetical protein